MCLNPLAGIEKFDRQVIEFDLLTKHSEADNLGLPVTHRGCPSPLAFSDAERRVVLFLAGEIRRNASRHQLGSERLHIARYGGGPYVPQATLRVFYFACKPTKT